MTWLNNCGTTPVGSRIVQKVFSYLKEYSQKGVLSDSFKYSEVKMKIKSILSKLLNCDPSELALIHNTSEGMNYISYGLDLHEGDKILLLEDEYPSNVYPFEHWKDKGVELEFIPLASNEKDFLENIQKKLTPNVKAISISAVHWCTGIPFPLVEIGKLCEEKKIDFILDGAQGVGHTKIDLTASNISYMAFPAWKWLLGPLGMGVMYVKKNNLEKLKPIFKGQNSVEKSEEYLPYKEKLKNNADRFEISTCNFTDWVYFLASLEILDRAGFEKVQNRLYALGEFLSKSLTEIGMKVYSDNFQSKTAIIVFEKPGRESAEIAGVLQKNKIVCAVRLNRIRLAPHVYNSIEQLKNVIEILKSA